MASAPDVKLWLYPARAALLIRDDLHYVEASPFLAECPTKPGTLRIFLFRRWHLAIFLDLASTYFGAVILALHGERMGDVTPSASAAFH